jgi:hypothetical protein
VFVQVEADELQAKVRSAKPVIPRKDGALVWIQVTNRSDFPAEPIAFRLTPKKKGAEPIEVQRMPVPGYGRAGRVVLPGEKLDYPVVLTGDADLYKKARVDVIEASFVDGLEPYPEPELVIGKPKTESRFREEWQTGFDHTLVTLENRTKLDLDLVFLAKFTGRFKGEGLVFASLDASEEREVVWDMIPLTAPVTGSSAVWGYQGIELSKLELVDWSVRVDDGRDVAAELLAEAWGRRAQLTEEQLTWTADCRVTLRGHNELARVPCRLGFDAAGRWRIADPGELEGGGLSEVDKYLRDLLQPTALRELPGLESELLLARWGPRPLLAHHAPGSDYLRYLGLADGAIASRGRESWSTRQVDAGWLLEHVTDVNGAATTELDYTWKREGSAWLPKTITVRTLDNMVALWPELLELELKGWGP